MPPMGLHQAIVIGGGIGGLSAALALHRQGIPVTVHERAASLEPVGAGLALAPNALRALDRLGVGHRLRALAAPHPAIGVRHPSGRWLARTSTAAVEAHFGDPIAAVPRADVIAALLDALPEGTVHTDSPATVIDPGDDRHPAVVRTADGDRSAGLVVAADGIRSATRGLLFPGHPGPRYSGFTTWRSIVTPDRRPTAAGEVWGRGRLAGIVPLADGRVYVYGAALSPAGARAAAGEHAELQRLFGDWCAPVPQLFSLAEPDRLLRNDVWELADPLPAHHHGRVALLGDAAHAMCPFLGQGACQAIEDAVVLASLLGPETADPAAALPTYSATRLPRTTAIVTASRRAGALIALHSPAATLLRTIALTLADLLPTRTLLRRSASIYDWRPPAPVRGA
ncbi:FAD-dependent monooxygenase [Kitasatospora sp. NPDC017646]|uniref:FAD-dependent monooxygenase n=1 Tax=Kitasatospora sp. NPDC017646 TaxID=3364024 RepID=UPI00379BC9D1